MPRAALPAGPKGRAMGLIDSAVTIQGRLVTLRPVSREDYPALFRWRSSFETVHMLNFRRRIATFEEFVRELEGMLPSSILLLVRRAKTGDPIGYPRAAFPSCEFRGSSFERSCVSFHLPPSIFHLPKLYVRVRVD